MAWRFCRPEGDNPVTAIAHLTCVLGEYCCLWRYLWKATDFTDTALQLKQIALILIVLVKCSVPVVDKYRTLAPAFALCVYDI